MLQNYDPSPWFSGSYLFCYAVNLYAFLPFYVACILSDALITCCQFTWLQIVVNVNSFNQLFYFYCAHFTFQPYSELISWTIIIGRGWITHHPTTYIITYLKSVMYSHIILLLYYALWTVILITQTVMQFASGLKHVTWSVEVKSQEGVLHNSFSSELTAFV